MKSRKSDAELAAFHFSRRSIETLEDYDGSAFAAIN